MTAQIPRHLRHESGTVEAILLCAWFHNDLGDDAAHQLARNILCRYALAVDEQIDVIAGLLDEWAACEDDPEHYAWDNGLNKAPGMSWAAWSGATRDVLAADATVNAERLVQQQFERHARQALVLGNDGWDGTDALQPRRYQGALS